jgi:GT2 family glycosyltransferase
MREKDASVIVSSYNQSNTVTRIIRMLILGAELSKISADIIISDDGSKPEEVENIVRAIQKRNGMKYFNTRFVSQEDNGFRLAASRNNGIKLADSNLLIFIDGDCIPDKNFLNAHVEFHKYNERAICIGSRTYKPLKNLEGKTLNIEEARKFDLMGDMESYTINEKSKSNMPWKAVIGRNFSFKSTSPITLYDEMLVGWGFDDTSIALDLYKKGYTNIVFNPEARVTQYDDFDQTNDPFHSIDSRKIAFTQSNALVLMNKYEYDFEIFIELSTYLSYYAEPFDYREGVFLLNEEKKNDYHGKFSKGVVRNLQEAEICYRNSYRILTDYFSRHKREKMHPFFDNQNMYLMKDSIL